MDLLVTLIVAWLSFTSGLSMPHERPAVRFLTAEALSDLRYGSIEAQRRREVVAAYDDDTQTIYLSEDWSGHDPTDVSVLVHEIVHHLQNSAALKYECPAAREALAYEAQAKWLKLFGRDLASEFDLDAMTLKLMSSCMTLG